MILPRYNALIFIASEVVVEKVMIVLLETFINYGND